MSSTRTLTSARGQQDGADIEAVVFDIDGVLLDSKPANLAYYRALLQRFGYPPLSDAELEYGHSHTLRESIAHFTRAPEDVVDELFEKSRSLAGYPYELVQLPPGSEEALRRLGNRYTLAVMSSRIIEGIHQYLDLSGTHDLFDALVGYDDSERHKPHPEPLLVACERLGVSPAATVYVGDMPTDMACAHEAGAHFIAFGDAVPEAKHVVTHFDDLEDAISRLAR